MGFGDAVTPEPETVGYPTLLPGFEALQLKAYPVYTVIAEKYQAMVMLGIADSRMKDFHDMATIARRTALDGATLAWAIAATFARRRTPLPQEPPPVALRPEFAADAGKQRQRAAFIARDRLAAPDLQGTLGVPHALLWPATQVAASGSDATATWNPQSLTWA